MIYPIVQKQIDYIVERCKEINPLVVIQCITYNHKLYLKDALEGFVMQETDFPFVAIVHDDASTDGTAKLLKDYAEKYPNIIFPIFEEENQYSKHDGSLSEIMMRACDLTRAKYIALCEGDDYWSDTYKLQKQVNFLETHPNYSMCFTNSIEKWQVKNYLERHMILEEEDRDYSTIEIYKGFRIPTATVIYNKKVINHPVYKELKKIKNPAFTDLQLFLACSLDGKVRYLNEVTSYYRRLETGAASQFEKNQWNHIRTRIEISKILGTKFIKIEKELSTKLFFPTLKRIFEYFPDNLKLLGRIFWFNPLGSVNELKWFIKILDNKIKLN